MIRYRAMIDNTIIPAIKLSDIEMKEIIVEEIGLKYPEYKILDEKW